MIKGSIYDKYWERLKTATLNPKTCRKEIHLKVPYSLMKRVVKAVRKLKDQDWEFKYENNFDPYRMHWSYEMFERKEIEGHSVVILTISMDRRQDL